MAWRKVHLLLCVAIIVSLVFNLAEGDDHNRAIFIFGDSTADVGTNNNLTGCSAKANKPYNGIDYPNSIPTGRFSNGYNSIDSIVRLLGDYKESPPPFHTFLNHKPTCSKDILRGVNFASGGSGILQGTGHGRFGRVIPLGKQIKQFATARGFITKLLGGAAKSDQLISNSTFIISVGSNDLVDYQFSSRSFTPQALITNLTDTYAIHLQNLYKLGARKYGIVSVPPVGCCPAERAFNLSGECVQEVNDWAQDFYTSINSMLQNFSSEFQGVKYSLGNAYQMTMSIINNPSGSKFKDVITACCGDGISECDNKGKLCQNRDEHLFWDWFHPTQAASQLAAQTLVYDEGSFVTPMNFSRLAMN